MSIDEIIEEHARMKWYLGVISEWVNATQDQSRNNNELALRFAIEQVGFAFTFAMEGFPGLIFASQEQRYAMSDFEKCRACLYASNAPWHRLTKGEWEILRKTPLEDVAMNINTEKHRRRGGQPYGDPHPVLPAIVPVVSDDGKRGVSSEITISVEYERVGLAIDGKKATMSIEAARALVALLQEAASKAMDTYVENRR